MADKLTTLERQAAITAIRVVEDCTERYGAPHVIFVAAVTTDGHAAANALWDSAWSSLADGTLQSLLSGLLRDSVAKRDAERQRLQDMGQCGDYALEGQDVLA